MKVNRLVWLACLWAGIAGAQTAATDAAASCPTMSDEISQTLRWDVVTVPGMLFCRAVRTDSGDEMFAVTVSAETPFRPRRSHRAEEGVMDGREIQWYRGEVVNPKILIRETLIELPDERVMHIFMRASDQDTLARQQQMAQSLRLPSAAEP
jgi:hypothetical protein